MNASQKSRSASDESVRRQAAQWTVRRDRGLSAAESIEFELWLAEDDRHAVALELYTGTWATLGRIPPQLGQPLVEAAGRQPNWRWWMAGGLAAALAVGLTIWSLNPRPVQDSGGVTAPLLTGPRVMTLADGTIVRLNTGGKVVAHYTATERRVTLESGEAFFEVAKNPAVPFVVEAATVALHAVGTAFDVNLQSTVVQVLVTEGHVRVENTAVRVEGAEPIAAPLLGAGDRAVVALAPVTAGTAMVVTRLGSAEVNEVLDWQQPLIRLGGATLAELVAEFQRRTGQRIVLVDSSLAQLRLGGRFRADDVEGFVRLLEENYGMQAEHTTDGAIMLRRVR